MKSTFTFIILFTIAGSLTAQNTINNSFYFEDGPTTTWVKLIEMTTPSDGVDSQAEQTLVLNISSLPTGGANYRVVKTVSNGNWNNGSAQALQVGSNSISVAGVSFNRTVKIQFSSADIEFNAITINGESGYLPNQIGGSNLLDKTSNATWTRVLTLALISDGASSQATQTAEITITSLPSGGANYRVYKTNSNENDVFGSAQSLQVGANSISVAGVSFDRTVKVQFSGESTEFSSLSVNGTTLNLSHIVENNFEIYPNPAVDKISVRQIDNIRTIKVYNSLGSLVKEVRNTNEVDVSELSKGVHFLQVDNGNLTTRKFIKK